MYVGGNGPQKLFACSTISLYATRRAAEYQRLQPRRLRHPRSANREGATSALLSRAASAKSLEARLCLP